MINTDSIANISLVGIIICTFDAFTDWLGSTQHVLFIGFLIVIILQILNLAVRHKDDLLDYREKQRVLMEKYNVNTIKELENVLKIEPFHKGAVTYIKKIVSKK